MEADVSQDFQDYWNEYRIIEEIKPHVHSLSEEDLQVERECWEEREWLEAAGLSGVTEPAFQSGVEVPTADLEAALRGLTWSQAQAVRRRVELLNRTVRARRSRHHQPVRPHVSELFKDVENSSSDSRSRSATPDSLDSDPPSPSQETEDSHQVLRFGPGIGITPREGRRRLAHSPNNNPVLPHHALFSRSARPGGDIVASQYADGIKMVGYQRLGSVRVRERSKSGSDPMNLNSIIDPDSTPNKHQVVCVTRSHDSLFDGSRRVDGETLGFEQMWAGDALSTTNLNNNEPGCGWEESSGGRTWVDFLAEEDMAVLRPILFMELTALMDASGISVTKSKPPKRKRKDDGSLFGSSLLSLLERDHNVVTEPHFVPVVFQKVISELERRGLREEGLLRVAGNRQRVDALANQLDREFYSRPEVADDLLQRATSHELTSLLKRLLRMLPYPLLTDALLPLFYHSHGISDGPRALNLLVLLLPPENRATLYLLLSFLSDVVANQQHNKMSKHNVAMIIAPSLFPPNILTEKSGLKAELGLAVQCCRLTELMMEARERLWLVPPYLVAQLRAINDANRHKENKPISKFLGKKSTPLRHNIINLANGDEENIVVQVDASQFLASPVSMRLEKQTTAADVVLRIVESGREVPRSLKLNKRSDLKCRALSELAPNGNLSCLLSTGDPDTALQTHFLYEVGGNIGQRRLEPSAHLLSVYHNNPNAQWAIKCDHRNGSHRILKRV